MLYKELIIVCMEVLLRLLFLELRSWTKTIKSLGPEQFQVVLFYFISVSVVWSFELENFFSVYFFK